MARLTLEEQAVDDPRFKVLGTLLGAPEDFAQGFGLQQALRVWRYCQQHTVYVVPAVILDALKTGLGDAMVAASLASKKRDGFRIHGTKGRIEWVKKLRDGNRIRKRRSRVSHATVTRDNPGALTPALALTPTQEQEPETTSAPRSARPPLALDGFSRFWKAYPARNGHKALKRDAQKAWRDNGLEPRADEVIVALERQKAHREECVRAGAFAAEFPDAVRWIRKRRWEDELGPVPAAQGLPTIADRNVAATAGWDRP